MYVSEKTDRAAQARHLQELLIARLAQGREWATPGIETALRRALVQVDAGIDVASPRLQATLRAIADELAGGVETVTPRVHKRLARIMPGLDAPVKDKAKRRLNGRAWLVVGAAVAAALAALSMWRVLRVSERVAELREATARKDQPVQDEPFAATPPDSPSARL